MSTVMRVSTIMRSTSALSLGSFTQTAPTLHNPYTNDVVLQSYLRRHMPDTIHTEVSADLTRFSQRIVSEIDELGIECDTVGNLPTLTQFTSWGERVDTINTCQAWKTQKEGLVSIGYEKKWGVHARLYQIAKLLMYSPSAGLFTCPLAMTDGCARVLSSINDQSIDNQSVVERLTSRKNDDFITSGQWMTERMGGSDVGGGTETTAILQSDGSYKLFGHKWFTSATDADVALTLARVTEDGTTTAGSKGLSLFFLNTRNTDGKLNNIQVIRLKDKLGTRQVPTAELLLDGTQARLISPLGRGVASISGMLNTTRLHNAVASVGAMNRIVQLAVDYAHKRKAFGSEIITWPLHARTLADMTVRMTGAKLLLLDTARMFGNVECQGDGWKDDETCVRLLTPILKLHTAKTSMSVVSEGLECFGGVGYMEDSNLPRILRDVQVTPIWEGTTNVLSLDVLRVIGKDATALPLLCERVCGRLDDGQASQIVRSGVDNLMKLDPSHYPQAARHLAMTIGNAYIASLLIEEGLHDEALTFTQMSDFMALSTNHEDYKTCDAHQRIVSRI